MLLAQSNKNGINAFPPRRFAPRCVSPRGEAPARKNIPHEIGFFTKVVQPYIVAIHFIAKIKYRTVKVEAVVLDIDLKGRDAAKLEIVYVDVVVVSVEGDAVGGAGGAVDGVGLQSFAHLFGNRGTSGAPSELEGLRGGRGGGRSEAGEGKGLG